MTGDAQGSSFKNRNVHTPCKVGQEHRLSRKPPFWEGGWKLLWKGFAGV